MMADSSARPLSALERARYLAEAAAFFSFIGLFRLIGLDAASAIGGFIGRNIFYRAAVTSRARANLKAAFPDKTDEAIERIVRAMCDNLGRTVAEYAHLDKIGIRGPDARVETLGLEHAAEAAQRGKGVMFFSGHFGNWEVMPFVVTQLGYEGGEVYRPQNNPFVDRWLVRQRARYGPKDQVAKGPRGTRRIFTLLRRGKTIGLLVDQKTNEGVPALYFGREAMTTPAPAALALKLGAALVPAQIERLNGSRFRFRFHPAIEYSPRGDHERDVLALTAVLTRKIEEMVRERPSQWLWIHRRWPTARDQDQIRNKRAPQVLGGAGVAVEREGSSLT
jgi:Kdo2-lipid IVA lauroyltransferase/acyltransferase